MNMWFKRETKATNGVKPVSENGFGKIRRRKAIIDKSTRESSERESSVHSEKEKRRHSDIMDIKVSLDRRQSDESIYESPENHSDDNHQPLSKKAASRESVNHPDDSPRKGHRKALSLTTPVDLVKSLGDEWLDRHDSDKKKSKDSLWSEEERDSVHGSNTRLNERKNTKDKKKTSMEPQKYSKRVTSVSALNFLRRKKKTIEPVAEGDDRTTPIKEIIVITSEFLDSEKRHAEECAIIVAKLSESDRDDPDSNLEVDAEDEKLEEQSPSKSVNTASRRRVSRTISRSKSKNRGKSQTVNVNTLRKSQSDILKRAKKKAIAASRSKNTSVAETPQPKKKLAESSSRSSNYWPFSGSVKAGNTGGEAKREGSADDSGAGEGDTAHDPSQEKEDVRDGVLWRSPNVPAKQVNRAESCREPANSAGSRRGKQRNASDPNRLTANNSNDCEGGASGAGAGGAPSGSSSSSSLSSRSNDGAPTADQHASQSDFSEEEDALAETWSSTVPADIVDTLSSRLRKRQELIHELITSESSHVRWLKVLYKVFYRPLEHGKAGTLLTQDDIKSLFPNLPAVREKHARLYADLRALRREPGQDIVHIAPLATAMLNTLGDATYATCLSRFCRGQRMALDALRERRRKSKELATLLGSMEQHRLCGRLQLRELCAVVWQRLTKYQLLLENVLRTVHDPETEPEEGISTEDVSMLRKALDTAKDVLHRVDTAIRTAENQHRMRTIQNKLEVRGEGAGGDELRKLDLTSLTLLFEGELSIRVDSKKITLLALLTREYLVLLQRVDDKFLLKQMSQLTPLIKWSTVLFRPNAAVKNTFFLMNINGQHMYELSANTTAEYNTWTRYISEMPLATLAEGRNTRASSVLPNRERHEDSSGGGVSRNASDASRTSVSSTLEDTPDKQTDADTDTDKLDADTDKEDDRRPDIPPSETKLSPEVGEQGSKDKPTLTLHAWTPPPTLATAAAEADPAPLFAQRAFSAQERLRRLDHGITRALAAKGALVGELLGVPRDSVAAVAELAVADSLGQLDSPGAADLHQLLLAAHAQANQLTEALSKALNVSDAEVIAARHMAPWRDNRGLCDTCTRKRVDLHESHVTSRAGEEANAAADQLAHISNDNSDVKNESSSDVKNDNADVNTSSAGDTSAESIEIVPSQGELEKQVSFDMLWELDRPSAQGSASGRVLLEEIGETSTDPFLCSTAGSDAWLATRLVPVASGLQATLTALLQAVPALQADRHALRRELAALRDRSDAHRHHILSVSATEAEPSTDVVASPAQEQHSSGC